MTTRRAVLYLRQSPTEHGQEGIDRQRQRTTALASARGWDVVDEFVDLDVSASKSRGAGTGWARMLAGAAGYDVVVGVDMDRVLRSTRDLNTLIDHGLRLVTVDGEIDLTTADGEFRATMLAAIARFEVRRKGERQSRANAQRAAKGGVPKGTRLTGYTSSGDLVDEEAKTVRAMFDGFARGESLRTLADRFNSTPSTVRGILTNPRYAGRRVYKGEVVARGAWPPIVDDALFEVVQRILSDPRRKTNSSGSTARKHLGSGLFRCECGDPRPVVAGGDGERYRCRACGLVRSRAAVNDYVLGALAAGLSKPDALDAMRPASPDIDVLLTEQRALNERIDALGELVADGTLTPDGVRRAAAPLREKLNTVREALAAALSAPVLDELDGKNPDEIEAAILGLHTDRQRALIDAFMVVTLRRATRSRFFDPDTVGIEWKGRSGAGT